MNNARELAEIAFLLLGILAVPTITGFVTSFFL
jgi:hypothetical protein